MERNNSSSHFDDFLTIESASNDPDGASAASLNDYDSSAGDGADSFNNNSAPVLARFAKRAILSRVERTRREHLAQRASEILVQEQRRQQAAKFGSGAAGAGSGRLLQREGSSTGNLASSQSFFCRSTSYGDILDAAIEQERQAHLTPEAAAASAAGPSVDTTFQALVEELRNAMPRSGLPVPDIALAIDRFLGPDVPVHFINSLQRLRQVLREITKLAKSVRRHMDLHGEAMADLESILDEDAEDEEIARQEEEAEEEAFRVKQEALRSERRKKLEEDREKEQEQEEESNRRNADVKDGDDDVVSAVAAAAVVAAAIEKVITESENKRRDSLKTDPGCDDDEDIDAKSQKQGEEDTTSPTAVATGEEEPQKRDEQQAQLQEQQQEQQHDQKKTEERSDREPRQLAEDGDNVAVAVSASAAATTDAKQQGEEEASTSATEKIQGGQPSTSSPSSSREQGDEKVIQQQGEAADDEPAQPQEQQQKHDQEKDNQPQQEPPTTASAEVTIHTSAESPIAAEAATSDTDQPEQESPLLPAEEAQPPSPPHQREDTGTARGGGGEGEEGTATAQSEFSPNKNSLADDDDADDEHEQRADDDDELEEKETEKQPAWVGNVPRNRTIRPRQELLEQMSHLVQKADVHAARVIDDVSKWRKFAHIPQPFFHEKENVFFTLHRRYGAGLPFNKACDLLKRYAAGEVFFYVSPFDFSAQNEDSGGGDCDAGSSIRDAGAGTNPELFDDDDDNGNSNNKNASGEGSELFGREIMSEPSSPLGTALQTVQSMHLGASGGGPLSPSATVTMTAGVAAASGRSGGGGGGESNKIDMRAKWKKIESEADLQKRYLKRMLIQVSGGWYKPVLKVVTDLLWERHLYYKQQMEGRDVRGEKSGGSYMRFSSKGGLEHLDRQQQQQQQNRDANSTGCGGASTPPPPKSGRRLYDALEQSGSKKRNNTSIGSTAHHRPSATPSSAKPASAMAQQQQQQQGPRTSVAQATDADELKLGLDWKHLSAGCYIPIICRDLRQHLIMCYRCAYSHVVRTNPGTAASAGTAVQRLIALNASHLARRYLHLWQAALRRRKKLRLHAAQLAVRNFEKLRKLRFGTFMKFYNFRNESGRLWRPLLSKVRASLIRRYMHRLFLNRAINITQRAMRRAVFLRYYRTLHFLVVRRRVSGARVTFAEEGDRRKIRNSSALATRDALKELASATALVNPTRSMKLQMERYYSADGDALRVVAETGGGVNCLPSLMRVIGGGKAMLPFRRFRDACDASRATVVAEEFMSRRQLIFEGHMLVLMGFAAMHKIENR